MSYYHFTIDERESILIHRTKGLNFSQIGKLLHRHPSSISREWKRHTKENIYSPNKAQASYKLAKSHYIVYEREKAGSRLESKQNSQTPFS